MTYLDHVIRFWQKDIEHQFSTTEIALYFYILNAANVARWKNPFGLSNDLTMAKLRIGKSAFDTAKRNLKNADLIDFTPGNGRGYVYQYEIKGTIKVSKKHTLYPHLSDTLSDTLSKRKPSTSIDKEVKDKDTIPVSTETGGDGEPPGVHRKKNKKNLDDGNPVYVECVKFYDVFVRGHTGNGPKIDKVQGMALNHIITYLRTQVRAKDAGLSDEKVPEKVIESFRLILDNWHFLTAHLQGRTRLSDINSELQNILKYIKDGIDNKHTNAGQATGKAGPAATTVRNRGATLAELEALKFGPDTGSEERTEFTQAEVVD